MRSRPEISCPNTSNRGAVSSMIHDSDNMRIRRIRASDSPTVRARAPLVLW